MSRIKVLHVGIDTSLGGIETYLLKITSHFDFSRFQFDFLSFKGETPCFFDELSAIGGRFQFITSRRVNPLKSWKELNALIKKEKYDIIHCHLNSLSYSDAVYAGLKNGAKVIVHSRNAGSSRQSSSSVLCRINKIFLPYNKLTLLAVSDKAGEWMFGEKRKFRVINNGIDTEKYKFSPDKRHSFRKELGIEEGREVILHVGAFREQKNHSHLIDIFKEYSVSHPSSILILVGEGELKESIEEKVSSLGLEDRVFFLGQRLDLDYVLSGADKFLFPSLYEGFPNALLEAECSGLLCVSSSTITKEVMFDSCTCISLDDSLSNWVEALSKEKIIDRERYSDVVEEKGYGVKSEVKRLEEIYLDLSGDSNG